MTIPIDLLARRYVAARRARIYAKQAWHAYLDEAWGSEPAEHRHRYGGCQVEDYHGKTAPLCAICVGSDLHYQAYRSAANKCGGAHRALMRACEHRPLTPLALPH